MKRTKESDVKKITISSVVRYKNRMHITAPFYELVLQIKN
jgi:hypothetical protein